MKILSDQLMENLMKKKNSSNASTGSLRFSFFLKVVI